MEEDNKLNPEPIVPELLTEEEAENTRLKHPGGRPSIEKDPKKQKEYLRIMHLAAIGGLNNDQIASALEISVGTVKNARTWIRRNLKDLEPEDMNSEAEVVIAKRLRDLDEEISRVEKREPILYPNGAPVLDADGKPYIRIDKSYLMQLRRIRMEYERTKLDVRGMLQKSKMLVNQGTIVGQMQINTNHRPLLSTKMTPEDKTIYIGLLDKYGEPSERD